MRIVLALLIAGLACAGARAEPPPLRFVHASITVSYVFMLDLGTIRTEGDLKVAEGLMVARKDFVVPGVTGDVSFMIFSSAYDCQNSAVQMRSRRYFDKSGKLLGDEKVQGSVVAVRPETAEADVMDIVCRGEAPDRPVMTDLSAAVRYGRGLLLTIDQAVTDQK